MAKKIFLILGNQLFNPSLLKKLGCDEIFMAEDESLCKYVKHHKLKLAFYLTAMRDYRDELENNNFKVNYFNLDERTDSKNYADFFITFLKERKIEKIYMFQIEDKFLEIEILNKLKINNITYQIEKSPNFIFTPQEFDELTKDTKNYRMGSFYKQTRTILNILIDQKMKPVGGKWSFDEENRKKIPKDKLLPEELIHSSSNHLEEVKNIILKRFNDHPGELENIWFPTSRKKSEQHLEYFLQHKFLYFGDYEDAVLENSNFLFHSSISPMLNIGLLEPKYVVNKAISFGEKNNIPINSIEGFVRQIIGWREFVRGIYHVKGDFQYDSNFWNHSNKLGESWYNGTTGIEPLDDIIKTVNKDGYTHHIPRLMILSNIMNLSRVHPKEIYKWFMEMFIDSSDWVMVPNVFGMATFSDGGLMSTKPYTCGSNYILKMSNYKRGEWCDVVDGLYWKFTEDNLDFYKTNPRLSILTKNLEKMDLDRKKDIFQKAEKFIAKNTI